MALMSWTAAQYVALMRAQAASEREPVKRPAESPAPRNIVFAMTILIVLLFSKNAYTSGFTSYYTFYLIERFHVTVQVSQLMLSLYS